MISLLDIPHREARRHLASGAPHLASAKIGHMLAERIASRFAEATAAVFEGRAPAPRPVMGWLGALSLGGRVGATPRTIPLG